MYKLELNLYKLKKVEGKLVQDKKRKKLNVNMILSNDLMKDFEKGNEDIDSLIGGILMEALKEEYFKRYKKI